MIHGEELSEDTDNRGSLITSDEMSEIQITVFGDKPKKQCNNDGGRVTYLHLFMTFCSILLYFYDLGTDVYLVLYLYNYPNMMFECSYAFLCVIIPAVINSCVSFTMYDDRKRASWKCFILNFPCAILSRTVEVFYLSIQHRFCRNEDMKYSDILDKYSDLGILRIMECHLESAMQLALSISLSVNNRSIPSLLVPLWLSMSGSFMTVAWTTLSYSRASRSARQDQRKLGYCSSIVYFLGLFLLTTSRISVLSMALSENLTLTIIFLFVRGCFWTIFIWIFEPPWFCRNSKSFNSNSVKLILEIFFSYVLGFVYNFTFIPTGDKPKKIAYCCYYGVSMLENFLVAYVWYYTWKQTELNRYEWFSIMFYSTVTCSVLGIVILILYYMYFHPKVKISPRFDLVYRKFFRNSSTSTACVE